MTHDKLGKKNILAATIASVLALSMATAQAIPAKGASKLKTAKEEEKVRYIVKFKKDNTYSIFNDSPSASNGKTLRDKNAQRLDKHGTKAIIHMKRFNAAAASLTARQLASLKKDPTVDYVEIDPKRYLIDTITRTFNDYQTAAITPSAESTPYGITMVQANQVSDAATGNMKVCITDTGYEGNHEDLRPYTDAGITGDNDDGLGNNTGNWWQPGHAHGTHVAGTIAGLSGNGVGVTGVNPSGLLDLHIIKVFNNAGSWGYGSDMVRAVEQCQDAGANIISMSLGGGASSATEESAFVAAKNAGLINIAAAGNGGNTALSYPASYDSVMSVAAIDSNKNVASFSQKNSQVEIAAPGVAITSTVLNNGYATWDGTSMATPHVAGVAALVWSHFPSCTGEEIRNVMNATAQDLGTANRDNSYGYGLVQAKAMYDSLSANGCNVVTPPPPPAEDGVLVNGVAQTGISGAQGAQLGFSMAVPAGATDISFAMSGGTGDADMYVRFGSMPTTSTYDCRPYLNGNNENCAGTSNNGTYYVLVNGYSAFSGVSLEGNFTDEVVTPPGGGSYTNDTNVNIRNKRTAISSIDVTGSGDSGAITIDVDIKHTYIGDLKVTLIAPNGASAVLHNHTGGSANDIFQTYSINATSIEKNGNWRLEVYDNANGDTGIIDSWTINF
jgi:serine protease